MYLLISDKPSIRSTAKQNLTLLDLLWKLVIGLKSSLRKLNSIKIFYGLCVIYCGNCIVIMYYFFSIHISFWMSCTRSNFRSLRIVLVSVINRLIYVTCFTCHCMLPYQPGFQGYNNSDGLLMTVLHYLFGPLHSKAQAYAYVVVCCFVFLSILK